jgi:hypothetical protein
MGGDAIAIIREEASTALSKKESAIAVLYPALGTLCVALSM